MKENRKVTPLSTASQSSKWKLRAAIGLALGVSLASQGVNASTDTSTVTWKEGGLLDSSSWTSLTSWLGNLLSQPTINASTNLVFANASSNRLTPTNIPNLTLNSILFGANTNTSSYTIGTNSNTFTIGGGGVMNKDNLAQNLGAKFLLSNSTTFNAVSGGLNFTGAINLNNALSGSSTKTLTLNGDHDISISGAISNSGSINNVGEVTKTGLGTTTLSGNNSYTGATNIDGGTLALGANERLANTGTVNVNNGGTFDVKAKTETIGKLDLKSGGAIKGGGTLGALIVGTDYTNAGFGTGNLFNKSAGVTDTKINSSASNAATQQTLTVGTGTANNGITASKMAFGNLHVGTSAEQTYTIGNAGNTASSSLRGAVQNLGSHDSQLTGNGTTEAGYNWGDDAAIAAGTNIGPKIVKFTATTAGALFETLTVVNNFANTIAKQTLEIHGAAYDYAKMNPISPVTLANQRIGGTATQALSVTNGAANHEYSEKLDASISANSPIIASGSAIHGLAAGATNNTNFTVGVNTATAGNKSGIATIALVSSGTDTSELGDTDLHSQDVNVSGNVYRTASGSTAATVNLAAQHVGGSASKTLVVSNNVVNDGYSEKLDASFGAATGGISTSGVAGLIVAGGNSNAMSVGIDTTTAGAKSGNVGVNFSSNGTGTSGLATISNGSQNVIVSGDVYNYANAGLQHVSGGSTWDDKSLMLDFGNFTQGSGNQTATFSLANIGGLDSLYTDLLDGNYNFILGTAFSSSNVNNFTNLAGGSSLTNLDFLFNTSTVGNYVGSVFLASTGHNISGYLGALDGMTINFKGSVSGVAAVPVPAAAWLFLTGMVGLLGLGRRNKAI
ncbi:beta strand repeat-containing protein [Methylobacter psychrophilus]|uniref:beta strand repeat-containing protein n=1 Tax=Methylobacter psychrophilus TaxID=96941 RepID=UPI0021D4EB36|nr:choice-of-anchor D domain-containing protein [Methylobacter psychrophilus]